MQIATYIIYIYFFKFILKKQFIQMQIIVFKMSLWCCISIINFKWNYNLYLVIIKFQWLRQFVACHLSQNKFICGSPDRLELMLLKWFLSWRKCFYTIFLVAKRFDTYFFRQFRQLWKAFEYPAISEVHSSFGNHQTIKLVRSIISRDVLLLVDIHRSQQKQNGIFSWIKKLY